MEDSTSRNEGVDYQPHNGNGDSTLHATDDSRSHEAALHATRIEDGIIPSVSDTQQILSCARQVLRSSNTMKAVSFERYTVVFLTGPQDA